MGRRYKLPKPQIDLLLSFLPSYTTCQDFQGGFKSLWPRITTAFYTQFPVVLTAEELAAAEGDANKALKIRHDADLKYIRALMANESRINRASKGGTPLLLQVVRAATENETPKRQRAYLPWQGYSKLIDYCNNNELKAECRAAHNTYCNALEPDIKPPTLLTFTGRWLTERLETESDEFQEEVQLFCDAHGAKGEEDDEENPANDLSSSGPGTDDAQSSAHEATDGVAADCADGAAKGPPTAFSDVLANEAEYQRLCNSLPNVFMSMLDSLAAETRWSFCIFAAGPDPKYGEVPRSYSSKKDAWKAFQDQWDHWAAQRYPGGWTGVQQSVQATIASGGTRRQALKALSLAEPPLATEDSTKKKKKKRKSRKKSPVADFAICSASTVPSSPPPSPAQIGAAIQDNAAAAGDDAPTAGDDAPTARDDAFAAAGDDAFAAAGDDAFAAAGDDAFAAAGDDAFAAAGDDAFAAAGDDAATSGDGAAAAGDDAFTAARDNASAAAGDDAPAAGDSAATAGDDAFTAARDDASAAAGDNAPAAGDDAFAATATATAKDDAAFATAAKDGAPAAALDGDAAAAATPTAHEDMEPPIDASGVDPTGASMCKEASTPASSRTPRLTRRSHKIVPLASTETTPAGTNRSIRKRRSQVAVGSLPSLMPVPPPSALYLPTYQGWVENAHESFRTLLSNMGADELQLQLNPLLDLWVKFEAARGYADRNHNMPSTLRPKSVAWWMTNAKRDADVVPDISVHPRDVTIFASRWWEWLNEISPAWRRLDQSQISVPVPNVGLRFSRSLPPDDAAWGCLSQSGSKGMILVLVCLIWWGTVIPTHPDARLGWLHAVEEMTWIFQHAGLTSPSAPTGLDNTLVTITAAGRPKPRKRASAASATESPSSVAAVAMRAKRPRNDVQRESTQHIWVNMIQSQVQHERCAGGRQVDFTTSANRVR
ncbi:hypothetical protein PUNSTDRAFT_47040 [Punctularia strigosozonata HHB-11173 SS5]|uniref:Uncharacterized protein n=1 Tax=Punctularia strigosozonata (strain HHB-11173) TaxID=741275 RepID=R7S5J3_PUNST|nr:uncharacterized protein PUNSTDRAFT_47040 [Punctularia strigosozonata HHB-11173 SS5]EIN05217.1 hypothetical protein PUNSTDRAFT_47040 [Punctularia strigosozonata HHB-11173 SS5]